MKKKNIALLLALVMLSIIPTPYLSTSYAATKSLKIGDYVPFGSYYEKPILWRVINLDRDGDPLLYSEYVLCLKAFDAAGPYHKNKTRSEKGSSYWVDSNIRQWLNSDQNTVKWLQNAPSTKNLFSPASDKGYSDTANPYDKEKGFLAEGNFSANEKNAIKPIKYKTPLVNLDKEKSNGQSTFMTSYWNLEKYTAKSEKLYYKWVIDKVFFPSVQEIKEYICNRNWEYRTTPTKEAVENATYKYSNLSTKEYWSYWIGMPSNNDVSNVRYVVLDGNVHYYSYDYVNDSSLGIRPAMYLNMKSFSIKSGDGIKSKPYAASDTILSKYADYDPQASAKNDKPSDGAEKIVNEAIRLNLVPAKLQGDYLKPVTEEEFAELLMNAGGYPNVNIPTNIKVKDFDDHGSQSIKNAYILGLLNSISRIKDNPKSVLTKQEAALMLADFEQATTSELNYGSSQKYYKDYSQISNWAKSAVDLCYSYSLLMGTGGKFEPLNPLTRELAIVSAYKAFNNGDNSFCDVKGLLSEYFFEKASDITLDKDTITIGYPDASSELTDTDIWAWQNIGKLTSTPTVDKYMVFSANRWLPRESLYQITLEKKNVVIDFGFMTVEVWGKNYILKYSFKQSPNYLGYHYQKGYHYGNSKTYFTPRLITSTNEAAAKTSIDSIKFAIKPQFDNVSDFKEGMAVVINNGNYGFINTSGKLIIPTQYNYANSFSDGLAAIKKGNKWGFIDKAGKKVIDFQYDKVFSFNEGLAVVQKNGAVDYINKSGKKAFRLPEDQAELDLSIPLNIYDNNMLSNYIIGLGNFNGGLAPVTVGAFQDSMGGYIDKTGKWVIKPEFAETNEFSEGLGVFMQEYSSVKMEPGWKSIHKYGKKGFMDKKGNIVIEPQFDSAHKFSDNMSAVLKGGLWVFIDKTGKTVVKNQYKNVHDFSNGLAAVLVEGKWGFIDKSGNVVIEPSYYEVHDFTESYAAVKKNGKWGLIDKTGKFLIEPLFTDMHYLSEGFIASKKGTKWGFIALKDLK